MDNSILALILAGFGGGGISALIGYFANKSVNSASTAKTLTEAANSLVAPLNKRIDTLEKELAKRDEQLTACLVMRDKDIALLKCKIQALEKENLRWENENTELKKRVLYLEEVLTQNGLAHLLKKVNK